MAQLPSSLNTPLPFNTAWRISRPQRVIFCPKNCLTCSHTLSTRLQESTPGANDLFWMTLFNDFFGGRPPPHTHTLRT